MTADKTLTLEMVAKLAGTSKSTVSRVLSNDPRISEKTRQRVNRVIERSHYRPNLFARALAGGKTGLIGVISSNIGSGFYAEVIRGIDLVFSKLNKRLLVSFAHYEHDYEALWQDLVLGGQVEGLIVLAPTSDFFSLKLNTRRIPMVICVGHPPAGKPGWKNVNRINMDNEGAMFRLVRDLADRGHRNLMHAAGWSNNTDAIERRRAFGSACRKFGVSGASECFGIIQEDGKKAMQAYLAEHRTLPDGIICFNDSVALGILEAWHGHAGHDAPPPFALSGWDDSPAAAVIGLTSVSVPCIELGEEAAHLLDKRLQGGKNPSPETLFELNVVDRASTDLRASA